MNVQTATINRKVNWTEIWARLNPYVIIIMLIILAIYAAIMEPAFLTGRNMQNIMRQFGALSLTAIGMTFVIIAGLIDLSIVGMFSFVSVFTISLIPVFGEVPALLLGIGMGMLCGLVDGIILTFIGARSDADAVFVTFGMSTFFYAMALIWSKGTTIRLPDHSAIISFIGKGEIFFLPVSFFIFLIVMFLAHILLMKTRTGREIRLVGGNRDAARLCGISSGKVTVLVFMILGFTVAIGSIIAFSRTTTAAPVVGKGYEMNSILSVVIGGTRLKGGLGSVIRTTIGVLLVTIMANALNLMGVPVNMQGVAKGAILVIAIWLDYRRK